MICSHVEATILLMISRSSLFVNAFSNPFLSVLANLLFSFSFGKGPLWAGAHTIEPNALFSHAWFCFIRWHYYCLSQSKPINKPTNWHITGKNNIMLDEINTCKTWTWDLSIPGLLLCHWDMPHQPHTWYINENWKSKLQVILAAWSIMIIILLRAENSVLRVQWFWSSQLCQRSRYESSWSFLLQLWPDWPFGIGKSYLSTRLWFNLCMCPCLLYLMVVILLGMHKVSQSC